MAPLAVLATRMPWQQIEASVAPLLARKDRRGRSIEGADLFGPTVQVVGAGVSAAGRPRLAIRLMVSLLYLKHAYGLSDEAVVERWAENVVWQFFSGQEYYEPRLPCSSAEINAPTSSIRRVLIERRFIWRIPFVGPGRGDGRAPAHFGRRRSICKEFAGGSCPPRHKERPPGLRGAALTTAAAVAQSSWLAADRALSRARLISAKPVIRWSAASRMACGSSPSMARTRSE